MQPPTRADTRHGARDGAGGESARRTGFAARPQGARAACPAGGPTLQDLIQVEQPLPSDSSGEEALLVEDEYMRRNLDMLGMFEVPDKAPREARPKQVAARPRARKPKGSVGQAITLQTAANTEPAEDVPAQVRKRAGKKPTPLPKKPKASMVPQAKKKAKKPTPAKASTQVKQERGYPPPATSSGFNGMMDISDKDPEGPPAALK